MTSSTPRPLRLADRGRGPLLQRDYWAVVRECRLDAAGVAAVMSERFEELPPPEIVRFRRPTNGPLRAGDELEVHLRPELECAVFVLHRDELSFTLGTLDGHPEAGRITFGAYPNDWGDIVVHIRSRARAATRASRLGFLFAGDAMQTLCWTDFLNHLAVVVGEGVRGTVHTATHQVTESEDDIWGEGPTFRARAP